MSAYDRGMPSRIEILFVYFAVPLILWALIVAAGYGLYLLLT